MERCPSTKATFTNSGRAPRLHCYPFHSFRCRYDNTRHLNMSATQKIAVHSLSGMPHQHLYINSQCTKMTRRPQEHNRRCAAQLPKLAQIQANPHPDRCTISPRLHSRHHRWRALLLRLEIRLGSQQAIHPPSRRCLLSPERRLQLLAVGRGEGCCVRG